MFQPFEVVLLYMCAAGDGYDAFMSCALFEHLYFMMEVKKISLPFVRANRNDDDDDCYWSPL